MKQRLIAMSAISFAQLACAADQAGKQRSAEGAEVPKPSAYTHEGVWQTWFLRRLFSGWAGRCCI